MATSARETSNELIRRATGPRGRSPLLWQRLQEVLAAQSSQFPDRAVTVLDCGGGSGSLAVPLAALGAQVTVVDVSIDALSTLLRRAAEAGVSDQVSAVQGEAESLAELLPAAQFDLVLAHEVLGGVSHPDVALAQLRTVLRPAGVLSVLLVNPVAAVLSRVLAGDVAGALAAFQRPPAARYDLTALVADCEQAGLSVDSIEGIGVFTEFVPGVELDRRGAAAALAELETVAASASPYRDIASRLHVLTRPATPSAD